TRFIGVRSSDRRWPGNSGMAELRAAACLDHPGAHVQTVGRRGCISIESLIWKVLQSATLALYLVGCASSPSGEAPVAHILMANSSGDPIDPRTLAHPHVFTSEE